MGYQFRSQNSFSAGSLSTLQQGRYDSKTYKSSVSKLENMIPIAEGPAVRRPGTHFGELAQNATARGSRLVPFYFGEGQAYMLELYADGIRVFKESAALQFHDSGDAVSTGTYTQLTTVITVITAGTFTIGQSLNLDFTPSSPGNTDGIFPVVSVVSGGFTVTGPASQTVSSPTAVVTTIGRTDILVSGTDYTSAQIHELDVVQSADVLYITHEEHVLKRLERTIPLVGETGYGDRAEDGTYWAIVDVEFEDGPWSAFNTDNTELVKITTGDGEWLDVEKVGIDTTTNAFTIFGHGLRNGMRVRFTSGSTFGNLDNGVILNSAPVSPFTASDGTAATEYYIVSAESSAFSLSSTFEGSPIAFNLWVTVTKEWTGIATIQKNIVPHKKTSGGASTLVTITSDAGFFESADAGSTFRINMFCGQEDEKTKGVKWQWFKLVTVATLGASCTAVPQGVVSLFDDGEDIKSREWAFAALGGRYKNARKCQIHQQRLILASAPHKPTTLWLSNTGDLENFAPDTAIGVNTGESDSAGQSIVAEQILENNSLTLTIDSDTVDRIYWMAEGKKLAIGTSGGIFHLYGSETSRTVTPTNFTIVRDSNWESADVAPVRVGDALIYTQLGSRKIRGMLTEGGNYPTTEVTMTTDYFLHYSIKQIVHQKQPYSIVWMVREDGRLVSMSFDEKYEFSGWALHTIGGSEIEAVATYGNHAKVESIGVIPRTPDDRLWMIVRRTIGGATVRHVEYMENFFVKARDTQEQVHFVDSGIRGEVTDGHLKSQMSGLDHLLGETVDVVLNGSVAATQVISELPDHTTSNPKIGVQWDPAYTGGVAIVDVVTGLTYDSHLYTLPVREGADGSIFPVGRVRMIKAHIRLKDTLGIRVGLETLEMEDVLFRTAADSPGIATPLYTGTKIITIVGRTEDEEILKVECSAPLPCTILNVITEHEVNIG